ncbi:beta-1,3-galactosyltransferase 1-like [Diorhabda carinulata]|uniref:beta-1,3-galactosyltransferase 1-like n=1 Tax=Diorhabda carinulata TaxID=1163345 RepID=UPI0025A17AEE|nr:beta-1,3-galactosyltransferase 1-like [Diorhabda carinulata]XP_057672486.1 beta-1,3-galactosyltransferase 1-like [Diorhabda carinulata]
MICMKTSKTKITSSVVLIICVIHLLEFLLFEHEVDGWNRNSVRNISYYFTENLAEVIPKHFCKSNIKLLIIVTSAVSNVNERQAIRETWGSEKTVLGQDISILFFLGNSLDPSVQDAVLAESYQYDDIIQEKFIDSYYNLTLKSALAMKLIAHNCIGKAEYLLKIDDDMFLQTTKLMEIIIARKTSTNVLIGKMICDANPIKDPFSKWYCPSYMFNKTYYPNFLSGTGYLMSMDVTKRLIDAAIRTPLIHLEDVYLTGICAEKAGVFPVHDSRFTSMLLDDEPCIYKDLITMHQFPPERMRAAFSSLKNSSHLEKCSSYVKMFNVQQWIIKNIFTPFARSKRKRICE